MLASVGVLVMSDGDVGWKLMLVQWLEHRNEADKDLLTSFCDTYIQRIVEYITECTKPEIFGAKQKTAAEGEAFPRYTRCIQHSILNMVHMFMVLLEVTEYFELFGCKLRYMLMCPHTPYLCVHLSMFPFTKLTLALALTLNRGQIGIGTHRYGNTLVQGCIGMRTHWYGET